MPVRDDRLQSTVPGLFVAGETTGIGGAAVALTEGRLAACHVAADLGRGDARQLATTIRSLAGQRRRQRRFGALVNVAFAPLPGLDHLATAATPVCRCEEVLADELRTLAARGMRSLDELKTASRVGQGPCQGRTCGPLAARILAQGTGLGAEDIPGFSVRPPVKPVPLAALATPMRETQP